MRVHEPATNSEIEVPDGEPLVSRSDSGGCIVFANLVFVETGGFSGDWLIPARHAAMASMAGADVPVGYHNEDDDAKETHGIWERRAGKTVWHQAWEHLVCWRISTKARAFPYNRHLRRGIQNRVAGTGHTGTDVSPSLSFKPPCAPVLE